MLGLPIVGLEFGADAGGEKRTSGDGGEQFSGTGVFCRREVKTPGGRIFEVGLTQLREITRYAGGLRLKEAFAGGAWDEARGLSVLREGSTDDTANAAEAKEGHITLGGGDAAAGTHVDQHLGTPPNELPPQEKESARAAHPDDVTEVAMDEPGVLEDRCGGGGLGVDRYIRQHAPIGMGEGSRHKMKRRKSDQRIPQTAEAVDQNPFSHMGAVGHV